MFEGGAISVSTVALLCHCVQIEPIGNQLESEACVDVCTSCVQLKLSFVLKKRQSLGYQKKKRKIEKNGIFGNFRAPGPRTSSPGCDFTSISGRRAPEDYI